MMSGRARPPILYTKMFLSVYYLGITVRLDEINMTLRANDMAVLLNGQSH
jgi:hypothetical protein